MINVGIAFSRPFEGDNPVGHIGAKLPVYLRLLEFCRNEEWNTFVLTRKTYKGEGVFDGVWKFKGEKEFEVIKGPTKIDLVYDRSAGVKFPPKGDESVIWVNRIDFKKLAWDKWAAYRAIGGHMPQTSLVESEGDLSKISAIKSDWVVLKPFNGLKGLGIFIGSKEKAMEFKFEKKYKKYIAQEFINTSAGISGVISGPHDLRVAVVNGKIVWSHVRTPPKGSFKANVADGGTLTEIKLDLIPGNVRKIVDEISVRFENEYDNPVYSVDFGIGNDGKPYIFEINDQIGFPKWEMKNRDNFLRELVANFKIKLFNQRQ